MGKNKMSKLALFANLFGSLCWFAIFSMLFILGMKFIVGKMPIVEEFAENPEKMAEAISLSIGLNFWLLSYIWLNFGLRLYYPIFEEIWKNYGRKKALLALALCILLPFLIMFMLVG